MQGFGDEAELREVTQIMAKTPPTSYQQGVDQRHPTSCSWVAPEWGLKGPDILASLNNCIEIGLFQFLKHVFSFRAALGCSMSFS